MLGDSQPKITYHQGAFLNYKPYKWGTKMNAKKDVCNIRI